MRVFHCDRCGSAVAFASQRCPGCGAALGYVTEELAVRALVPTSDPASFTVEGSEQVLARCHDAAWGCNWMVPADSITPWCRSCRLTRGRPAGAPADVMAAWTTVEAAKRRVIHQLDELALPIEDRSDDAPNGLAFDVVHLAPGDAVTGHVDGVITMDLAGTDDARRFHLRSDLDQTFHTVTGHFRHEIGHHLWARLVGQSDDLEQFRRLFGDERLDDRGVAERHDDPPSAVPWDPSRFITACAASHPLEDWAETFAHYLHIIDVAGTAVAHEAAPAACASTLQSHPLRDLDLDQILSAWRPINAAMTAIAESLGTPVPYPFDPRGLVVEKLAFVHRQVAAHTERDRFYADH